MAELVLVRKNSYHDSVTLMTLSNKLKKLDGVADAVVSMGTDMNKDLLAGIGLLTAEAAEAGPNDLLIAIRAGSEAACDATLAAVDGLLNAKKSGGGREARTVFRTIGEAKREAPELNMAVISVKGEFAAREARQAVEQGMHVMLFSDNVTEDEELAVKRMAHEKGLLVMGPDCGTAILDGVGLCFANAVRRGSVGLVAASGTGLQEVTVLLHRMGAGVSQAIGTGGRDLSAKIGGIMMLDGLRRLEEDEDTAVICLVSKPPVRAVAEKIMAQVKTCTKPVVICFIAGSPELLAGTDAHFAANLEDAAAQCAALVRGEPPISSAATRYGLDGAWLAAAGEKLRPEQRYIRGLYCGGTLASETATELERALGAEVYSNVSKKPEHKLADPMRSVCHAVVDLGDDVFTVGRPHPMIEPGLRNDRLLTELTDPETAVVLLDFELGYGSHEDPVGVTLDTLRAARVRNAAAGREVAVVAYLLGTDEDFQGMAAQRALLEGQGVYVAQSNLHAAQTALALVRERG